MPVAVQEIVNTIKTLKGLVEEWEQKLVEASAAADERLKSAVPPAEGDTTVYVRALTGKSITAKCSLQSSVLQLKEEVQRVEGIPADQQMLVFAGKKLHNKSLIGDYGIQDQSSIHMILRLRGGMMNPTSGRSDMAHLPTALAVKIQAATVLQAEARQLEEMVRDAAVMAPGNTGLQAEVKKCLALTEQAREMARKVDEERRASTTA